MRNTTSESGGRPKRSTVELYARANRERKEADFSIGDRDAPEVIGTAWRARHRRPRRSARARSLRAEDREEETTGVNRSRRLSERTDNWYPGELPAGTQEELPAQVRPPGT